VFDLVDHLVSDPGASHHMVDGCVKAFNRICIENLLRQLCMGGLNGQANVAFWVRC
jgi:hypothetical protein